MWVRIQPGARILELASSTQWKTRWNVVDSESLNFVTADQVDWENPVGAVASASLAGALRFLRVHVQPKTVEVLSDERTPIATEKLLGYHFESSVRLSWLDYVQPNRPRY